MIRIAVDAMGGDRGPAEIVAGALEARSDTIEPILFGDAAIDARGLELHADDRGDRDAREAGRGRPREARELARRGRPRRRRGRAPTRSSRPGNTGAMLAAGLLELRRLPGVMRPAIAVPIPAERGPSVLLDAGANADARAEHLLQFATMGAVFAEEILGVARPRGAAPLDRRGAREGEPADARGARAPRRERPQLRAATPRAATSCAAPPTSSSPTASPATSC